FRSAADLADELGRWLRGEPLRTRPPSLPGRVWASVHRHPVRAGAVAVLAAGGVTALVLVGLLDPDRPLKEVRDDLAAGRPVTLLGDDGLPRWSRWRAGQTGLVGHPGPAPAVDLRSFPISVLQVFPDPGVDAYEFSARVRHDDSEELGEVGLV